MTGTEVLIIVIGLVALGLLLKQVYSLRQKSRNVQSKAASLEDEVTRLWTTQSELSSEAKRLQAEVDRLTAENRDLKQRADQPRTSERLSTSDPSLVAKNLDLTHHLNQLKQEIANAESQKKALEIEISQLKEGFDLWQEENQAIEAKHDVLLERDQRLEAYPELIQIQAELNQKIMALEQEKAELSEQLWQAQAQIQRDLQGLHRIKIVSACRHHSTSDQELFHATIAMDFSRVREALDFAETMFGDVLEVWDSARAAADASNFIRPDDAYRALQSLAWFGQYYFERNGEIGNTHYHVLKADYNLDCTPESTNVQNSRRLRSERCFWHDNQRKEMFDHLKLGGGNGMNNILRIYFDINRESRKIEIGHCGKHLSN